MKYTPHPVNFKYPEIKQEHYRFGSQNAGDVIREDGDWRDYTPPDQDQNMNGVESSACYKYANLRTIATIQEEEFNLPDQIYSARFNDQDGSTPEGGDPLKFADSARKLGLIPEPMLPFSAEITTWDKFNSFFGANKELCIKAGQQFLKRWKINNYIVFEKNEPIESKYAKLREALKRSPVPMSVYAWVENGGVYVKPQGLGDTHLTECVYLDPQNRPYFKDTYYPYNKIGEPFYNSDFAMRWTVKQIVQELSVGFWMNVINLFKKLLN